MARFCITILAHFFFITSLAQFNIRLETDNLPSEPKEYNLFIAGSFNGWNPANEKFKFQRKGVGQFYIDLKLPAGKYEYKITRGSWREVECNAGGFNIENRTLNVTGDTSLRINVAGWKDNFPEEKPKHSACSHVRIIDTAFLIPQLNRRRRIWIHLPENYYAAPKQYRWPVLYMHDGQNVFDDATSFSGEWGVDEFLDTSMAKSCIVVAIDNGAGKRINEYCPYDFSLKTLGLSGADTVSRGEGRLYVDFLVKTLKPFIDKNFRTLKDKKNTFIAGSSMGGLISMYAVLKYPKVFGGAGVFSPAFWVGPGIFDDIKTKGSNVKANIFFYAGKQESESMVPDMLKAFQEMAKVSKAKMKVVIRDDGKHNELTWRKEFPEGYIWMLYPYELKKIETMH